MLAADDGIERIVVGERRHAHVRVDEGARHRAEGRRASRDQLAVATGRAVGHEQRIAGLREALANRLTHVAESDQAHARQWGFALRHRSSHPPSIARLTPFTPPFSSRNIAGVRRPRPWSRACRAGCAPRTGSSTAAGLSAQYGLSPTMPG